MTLLAGRLALSDVHDVEALCRSILNRELPKLQAWMSEEDTEDALAHLLEHVVRLWRAFDGERNTSFAGYAGSILPLRLPDWYRARFGRSGGRMLPAGSRSLQDVDAQLEREDALAVLDDPDVATLLDELGPASRRILEAKIAGVSRAEAARQWRISQKAAAYQEQFAIREVAWRYPDLARAIERARWADTTQEAVAA